MTTGGWFKTWLEGMAQRVAQGTVTTYTNLANFYVIPAVGRKRLDKVTPADFTAMTSGMVRRGLSTRTAQAAHKLLSQALKAAVRQGVIGHNPAEKIDAPVVDALKTDAAARLDGLLG